MTALSRQSQERVDDYIARLRESLASLPEDERTDAAEELRTHIEEAVSRISEDEAAAVATVLRGLGDPAEYAAGLLAEGTDREPAATAQVQPPASPAPAKPDRWGRGCIVGCVAALVVLVLACGAAYFWAQWQGPRPGREVLDRQQELLTPQPPRPRVDQEVLDLRNELLSTLARRDAAGMERLCDPELVADGSVSGAGLLLPDDAIDPQVIDTSRQEDIVRISVRAGQTVYEYEFHRHGGAWKLRALPRRIQSVPPVREPGSP